MSHDSSNGADELWNLFVAIHEVWGTDACRVEDMASQWREFIRVKTDESPSYGDEYRNARELISEIRQSQGNQVFKYLFFDPEVQAEPNTAPESRLAKLKTKVIDEFIRVYVTAGGFRSYGGINYGGFVSGSRYRHRPPYRIAEDIQS